MMAFREKQPRTGSVASASKGESAGMGSRHGVRPAPSEEDAEESPRGQGKAFALLPPKGEDPFRCYSREIGKVPLLTAEQEVKIGRRIEIGQIALRQALAGIPIAVRALLEMGDRLRRGETAAADVIVLPEGGGPEAEEVKAVLLAFGRIRRCERRIAKLRESLTDKRRSKATRAILINSMAVEGEAIQKIVADMPLKPMLIDDLVAEMRRRCERTTRLATEARHVTLPNASRSAEWRAKSRQPPLAPQQARPSAPPHGVTLV